MRVGQRTTWNGSFEKAPYVGTWWDPVGNYYYPLISSYLTREYLNKYGHIRSTYSAHSVENRLLHVQERSVTAIVIFE